MRVLDSGVVRGVAADNRLAEVVGNNARVVADSNLTKSGRSKKSVLMQHVAKFLLGHVLAVVPGFSVETIKKRSLEELHERQQFSSNIGSFLQINCILFDFFYN